MKQISLTQGKFAIVDDADYKEISKYKWHFHKERHGGYAVRTILKDGKYTKIYLHHCIIGREKGKCVDHINGDKLDNRRNNLRFCSIAENKRNMGKQVNNSSGFKGVSWNKVKKRWQAQIEVNQKNIYLGRFKEKLGAVEAYNQAAIKYHRAFAYLN